MSSTQSGAKVPQLNGKYVLEATSSEDKNDISLTRSFGSSQLLEQMSHLLGQVTLPQLTKA